MNLGLAALLHMLGQGMNPQQPQVVQAQPLPAQQQPMSAAPPPETPQTTGQKLGAAFGSDWTQPTGSGLAAYNPNPAPALPVHSSGILQSVMSDPMAGAGAGGGNGLQSLLMRLGIMQQ